MLCDWTPTFTPSLSTSVVWNIKISSRRHVQDKEWAVDLYISWTLLWVHCTHMAYIVTRSQFSTAHLDCNGTGDSCAANKSAAKSLGNVSQPVAGSLPCRIEAVLKVNPNTIKCPKNVSKQLCPGDYSNSFRYHSGITASIQRHFNIDAKLQDFFLERLLYINQTM